MCNNNFFYVKSRHKYYWYILFMFLILSVTSTAILFHTHTLFGIGDLEFHLRRIVELKDSIMNGCLFPDVSFNYFRGSAVMSMYPYISMYPLALILIFLPIEKGYYIFISIIIFISLILSLFSSLRYSKSLLISFIFSVIYSTSSVVFYLSFINQDLGILTSIPFIPLVIFGFINIINGYNDCVSFILGMTLLAYCQIPNFVVIFMFLILLISINIYKLNKMKLLVIMKSFIIMLLLTSIIWIPILHIILFNKIMTVPNKYLMGTSLKKYVLYISIFSGITIVLYPIYYIRYGSNYCNKIMYWLSVLIIILSSNIIPLKYITSLPILNLLSKFQITTRFLVIPQILLSYLFSIIFVQSMKLVKWHKACLFLFILFILLLQIAMQSGFKDIFIQNKVNNNNYVNMDKSSNSNEVNLKNITYFITSNNSLNNLINSFGGVGISDYYPNSLVSKNRFYKDNKKLRNYNNSNEIKHIGYNLYKIRNNANGYYKSPFICYNNEHLRIYLNNKSTSYHVNKKGFIILNDVKKGNYKLKINYISDKLTQILKWSIFILGIICFLIQIVFRKYSCNNEKENSY